MYNVIKRFELMVFKEGIEIVRKYVKIMSVFREISILWYVILYLFGWLGCKRE